MLKLVLTTDQTGPALEADLAEISNLLHVDVEAVGLDGYVSAKVSYLRPVDEPHPVFEKGVADVVPTPVPDVVVEPDAGPAGEVPVVETPAE